MLLLWEKKVTLILSLNPHIEPVFVVCHLYVHTLYLYCFITICFKLILNCDCWVCLLHQFFDSVLFINYLLIQE